MFTYSLNFGVFFLLIYYVKSENGVLNFFVDFQEDSAIERKWLLVKNGIRYPLYSIDENGLNINRDNNMNRYVCDYDIRELKLCYPTEMLNGFSVVSETFYKDPPRTEIKTFEKITIQPNNDLNIHEDEAYNYHLIFEPLGPVKRYEDINLRLNGMNDILLEKVGIFHYENQNFERYYHFEDIKRQRFLKASINANCLILNRMQRHDYYIALVINANDKPFLRTYPPIKFKEPAEVIFFNNLEATIAINYGERSIVRLLKCQELDKIAFEFDSKENRILFDKKTVRKVMFSKNLIHVNFKEVSECDFVLRGTYEYGRKKIEYRSKRFKQSEIYDHLADYNQPDENSVIESERFHNFDHVKVEAITPYDYRFIIQNNRLFAESAKRKISSFISTKSRDHDDNIIELKENIPTAKSPALMDISNNINRRKTSHLASSSEHESDEKDEQRRKHYSRKRNTKRMTRDSSYEFDGAKNTASSSENEMSGINDRNMFHDRERPQRNRRRPPKKSKSLILFDEKNEENFVNNQYDDSLAMGEEANTEPITEDTHVHKHKSKDDHDLQLGARPRRPERQSWSFFSSEHQEEDTSIHNKLKSLVDHALVKIKEIDEKNLDLVNQIPQFELPIKRKQKKPSKQKRKSWATFTYTPDEKGLKSSYSWSGLPETKNHNGEPDSLSYHGFDPSYEPDEQMQKFLYSLDSDRTIQDEPEYVDDEFTLAEIDEADLPFSPIEQTEQEEKADIDTVLQKIQESILFSEPIVDSKEPQILEKPDSEINDFSEQFPPDYLIAESDKNTTLTEDINEPVEEVQNEIITPNKDKTITVRTACFIVIPILFISLGAIVIVIYFIRRKKSRRHYPLYSIRNINESFIRRIH